jgi:hypothetical protein
MRKTFTPTYLQSSLFHLYGFHCQILKIFILMTFKSSLSRFYNLHSHAFKIFTLFFFLISFTTQGGF